MNLPEIIISLFGLQEYKFYTAAVVVVQAITPSATRTFHFITVLYIQVHLFNLAAAFFFLWPAYRSVIDQVGEADLN